MTPLSPVPRSATPHAARAARASTWRLPPCPPRRILWSNDAWAPGRLAHHICQQEGRARPTSARRTLRHQARSVRPPLARPVGRGQRAHEHPTRNCPPTSTFPRPSCSVSPFGSYPRPSLAPRRAYGTLLAFTRDGPGPTKHAPASLFSDGVLYLDDHGGFQRPNSPLGFHPRASRARCRFWRRQPCHLRRLLRSPLRTMYIETLKVSVPARGHHAGLARALAPRCPGGLWDEHLVTWMLAIDFSKTMEPRLFSKLAPGQNLIVPIYIDDTVSARIIADRDLARGSLDLFHRFINTLTTTRVVDVGDEDPHRGPKRRPPPHRAALHPRRARLPPGQRAPPQGAPAQRLQRGWGSPFGLALGPCGSLWADLMSAGEQARRTSRLRASGG